jgi:hypothetical protein
VPLEYARIENVGSTLAIAEREIEVALRRIRTLRSVFESAAAPSAANISPEDPKTGAQHSDPHGDPSHDRVSS